MIYFCRITYENLQRPVDAKVTEYYNLQNMDGKKHDNYK